MSRNKSYFGGLLTNLGIITAAVSIFAFLQLALAAPPSSSASRKTSSSSTRKPPPTPTPEPCAPQEFTVTDKISFIIGCGSEPYGSITCSGEGANARCTVSPSGAELGGSMIMECVRVRTELRCPKDKPPEPKVDIDFGVGGMDFKCSCDGDGVNVGGGNDWFEIEWGSAENILKGSCNMSFCDIDVSGNVTCKGDETKVGLDFKCDECKIGIDTRTDDPKCKFTFENAVGPVKCWTEVDGGGDWSCGIKADWGF